MSYWGRQAAVAISEHWGGETTATATTKLWTSGGHHLELPGSLCSLALPKVPQSGAKSPWENTLLPSGCSNVLLRLCHRHSLYIPILTAISLLLPGLSELVSPNQLLFSLPIVWVRNRRLRVAEPESDLTCRSCETKEEEGNSLVQPQEQEINSSQLAW